MAKTVYLETGSTDPRYNLAFEEYILTHRREGDYLILWQNASSVIVGRNQISAQEVNGEFVEKNGIRVVRRITGGGAVYHDLGNLNYSFICDAEDMEQRTATRFTQPVVAALKGLGLDAEASGRNDILVSGCKVSGTASHISRGRVLHHGTLLFDSDAQTIMQVLTPDPLKLQSKGIRSVKSRVGNIRHFLPEVITLTQFWDYLKTALSGSGYTVGSVTEEEQQEILRLKAEKYDTWQWNYGSAPNFQLRCKDRWDGGILEIHLSVEHGKIAAVRIFGDFMALTSCEELEQALIGCSYQKEAISAAIAHIPLQECLGGITKEEFLQTIVK
ncbi:MAG: lipoate--protein ligase [Oscillospiraceae bacterium]|nr:lipoate--protein ligase [Oscillospiraceae bacterium]